jgi:hypothetical protein
MLSCIDRYYVVIILKHNRMSNLKIEKLKDKVFFKLQCGKTA